MKVVILAGGLGTRMREETEYRPKPMVEIGDKPIIWHLMKQLGQQGVVEFVLAIGYKGNLIKDFFINYRHRTADFTVELSTSQVKMNSTLSSEKWKVTLAETGALTLTGGRLFKLKKYLDKEKYFLVTYGDGLADIDLEALVKFHLSPGKIATVTAAQPTSRFGRLDIGTNDAVVKFAEKSKENDWVNAGFFVFNREIFDYLNEDSILERSPLEALVQQNELMAFKHNGFWQPMDTIRESQLLNDLWSQNIAPWKNWA